MTALKIAFLSYLLASLCYAAAIGIAMLDAQIAARVLNKLGTLLIGLGMGVGIYMMTASWVETGDPPFRTLGQTLIFSSVTIAIVYLFAGRKIPLLGLSTALFELAVLAYGFVKRDIELAELPPALQSAWFVPHVVVYFFGYAALFVSFVTSILTLIFPKPREFRFASAMGLSEVNFPAFSYRLILFGFVMISAGLILGALWAKFAWGDWWSWDPKENWSFITWLVYGAYLHLRLAKTVSLKVLAWVSIVGFLAVMFTYLGVNYLPSAEGALHAYDV